MRYALRGGLLAAVFAGLLTLLAPATCYGVDTTFTVTVPARLPAQPPVAKFRITLELAGAVAGSTITVNNGSETSPAVPLPLATHTFANNDDLFATTITGTTDDLGIIFTRNSRFNGVPPNFNYCSPAAVPEEQTVTITISGPAVQAFRVTSYAVPGVTPCLDTGQATRRVHNLAATVGGFVAVPPQPAPTAKGRHPLDVILVLDKSGSMSSAPPGVGGPNSKWSFLENSIQEFIDVWEQANITDTGGLELEGDRIGLTFFSSTAVPADFGGGSIFKARGTDPPGMNHDWNDVRDAVVNEGPGGMTALGPGLQVALNAYEAGGLGKNDAVIVLMTDGMQNIAPLATPVPAGPAGVINLDPDGGGALPLKPLWEYRVPIVTVAFGSLAPGSPETQLLDAIASQTAGRLHIPRTAFSMDTVFTNALVAALKGSTLSINSQAEATLPAGTNASAPQSVLLDGSVRRAIFVLGWQGPPGALGLQINLPGAAPTPPIATPVIRKDGTTWTVQSVDIPTTGPIGQWSARVFRNQTPGVTAVAAPNSAAIPYHLSVYTVEGRLDYQLSLATPKSGTGDTMTLHAAVSYDGKPLPNVAQGIGLVIERPGSGLGTEMHNSQLTGGSAPPTAGDVKSPYDQKLQELIDREGLLGKVSPSPLPTNFTLRDDGNAANGDARAGDGIYSARFTDTSKPGLYRFNVTLDWDDPRTGRIRRVETIEREVKVTPDANASVVRADASKDISGYVVSVTPRDRFGNYVGPGYPAAVVVQSSAGTVGSTSDPRLTGDYTIPVSNVPAGVDPVITVIVDGVKIREDKASNLGGPPTGGQIPAPSSEKRWGLSLHAGVSIPHSNFSNIFNPGPNFGVDLEYRFNDNFSVEGIYTFHRFNSDFLFIDDLNVHQFSVNGKIYASTAPVKPFFNFGAGAYKFDPGNTRGGVNVGGGVQFNITPTFAVEGSYNFHNVFTLFSDTKFSTVQGGVRFRF